MPTVFSSAFEDLLAGFRNYRVWMALATEDIGDQHRRTTLGPLWLLINYLAFAATFAFFFNPGSAHPGFAVYVAIGLLVWFYIMEVISGSVILFVREESFIKGTTLPLSVFVMREALQAAIRAGYALIGCIAILLVSGTLVTTAWLWSGLGILVMLLTAPAVIICFAFLGAFFPDSQFIVSNLMRVGMFVTPVFWTDYGISGIRSFFYHYNPFTYFLDVVRLPIITSTAPLNALALCVSIGLIAWIVALVLLGTFRRQVALVL